MISPEATLTLSTQQIAAWGGDFYGQLDVLLGLPPIVSLAGGYYHTLALGEDGTVTAWGYSASGQTNVPPDLKNVMAIAAGISDGLGLGYNGQNAQQDSR